MQESQRRAAFSPGQHKVNEYFGFWSCAFVHVQENFIFHSAEWSANLCGFWHSDKLDG
jgi:hypothetical protein